MFQARLVLPLTPTRHTGRRRCSRTTLIVDGGRVFGHSEQDRGEAVGPISPVSENEGLASLISIEDDETWTLFDDAAFSCYRAEFDDWTRSRSTPCLLNVTLSACS